MEKLPNKHLNVQNQQQKHPKPLRNMFKTNNKGTSTTSMTPFVCLHYVFAWYVGKYTPENSIEKIVTRQYV